MKQYLRRYPLSLLLITAIWIVCIIPIPETPLGDVPMMDKWTHFVMFGVLCCVIFYEYVRSHKQANIRKIVTFGVVMPFLMGGAIELAQAYLTGGNRSGDVIDWLADGIGVLIGTAIGSLLVYLHSTKNKDI